jgi:hypothetical protein
MPARINVYCRRPTARLTADALRRELDDADLMTLAEHLELPEGEEAAVRAIRPHLRVEAAPGPELRYAEIRWKPAGRPIQISRATEVAAELAETLENLPAGDTPGARRVRAHLANCQEIIHFEMGIDDSLHLGSVLGEVLAFRFAEEGDGLIWFYYRDWASPEDRGLRLWTTE